MLLEGDWPKVIHPAGFHDMSGDTNPGLLDTKYQTDTLKYYTTLALSDSHLGWDYTHLEKNQFQLVSQLCLFLTHALVVSKSAQGYLSQGQLLGECEPKITAATLTTKAFPSPINVLISSFKTLHCWDWDT